MIEEIRKIKVQPYLEKLQEKSKMKILEEQRIREEKEKTGIEVNKLGLSRILEDIESLEKEKARIERASLAELGMDFFEAVAFLKEHNIEIVLTEEDKQYLYSKDTSKREYKGIEDFILVHKTDYIPEEGEIRPANESGVQLNDEMKLRDEVYNVKYASERNTVHFAVNTEVSSNDGGSWDNCKYAILIPFNNIPKEKIGIVAAQDTFAIGKVKLSKEAYILCPKGQKQRIQEKNPEANIIEYEDQRVLGYANALVRGLGYKNEECAKWSWGDVKSTEIFNEIMKKEGFESIGGAHFHSKYSIEENERQAINEIIAKAKLIKEKELIKGEEDLERKDFNLIYTKEARSLSEDGFDILVMGLEAEGITLSNEGKILIHNLYKIGIYLIDEEKLREGMPDTKETAELLEEFKKFNQSSDNTYITHMITHAILKGIERERAEKEYQQKRKNVLSRKVKDFEMIMDDDGGFYYKKDVESDIKVKAELVEEYQKKINDRLKEKGIVNYIFNIVDGVYITVEDEDWEERIDEIHSSLQGKDHYKGNNEMQFLKLDFKEDEEETLEQYFRRIEKYTEQFSRYYDGYTIDESVKFDENGEPMQEKIQKSDFEKVAIDRNVIIELQLGNITKEIRTEMISEQEKIEEEGELEHD